MRAVFVVGILVLGVVQGCRTTARSPGRGMLLEDMTWQEAERALTPDAVVVLPLGAAAKEHGPHLLLKNDWILAEYLKQRVMAAADVVVAPTIAYSYYPAFEEYPGSISLRLETARDLIVDACRSLARFGPKRFYVLNTGVSTRHALGPASEILSREGIAVRWTNLKSVLGPVEARISQQPFGSHADEIETSMMLYIAPQACDMSRALCDCHTQAEGKLTRDPGGAGTYSPTGSFGDPTLATREKGRVAMEAWVAA